MIKKHLKIKLKIHIKEFDNFLSKINIPIIFTIFQQKIILIILMMIYLVIKQDF